MLPFIKAGWRHPYPHRGRQVPIAGLLGMLMVAAAHGQTPAATPPKPAAAAPKAASAAVIPAPESVPDNVNPFADKDNLPKPLKLTATMPLNVEIRAEVFDGIRIKQMYVRGPDFEWRLDPFDDWDMVPPAYGESAAFIYQGNPKFRLALTLYGNELMPEINPEVIAQYLATVRAALPNSFVLLTPIPQGLSSFETSYFAVFNGQSVDYAITSPAVVQHHTWFMDGNHEYVLVVDLSGTPLFVQQEIAPVRFALGRSRIVKGLKPKAAPEPAPADAGGTPAAKS